jgi:uncharacterized protein (DUF924 family)
MNETGQILDFWFGPLQDGFAADTRRRRWFGSSPEIDEEIRSRFEPSLRAAAAGSLQTWCETARGTLAFVLVTDQFSRQIHRGSARAFATDALALAATRSGIARGFDAELAIDERVFLYMPFEHSESREDQAECLRLFTALTADTPDRHRHITDGFIQHVVEHRDIIERVGRFPHRNEVLGRTSTTDELQFLQPGRRFGQ